MKLREGYWRDKVNRTLVLVKRIDGHMVYYNPEDKNDCGGNVFERWTNRYEYIGDEHAVRKRKLG